VVLVLHRRREQGACGAGEADSVPVDLTQLRPLLDQQSGIVSRRQAVEAGADRYDLRRWLRSRALVEVHKGVYINHTGPLSWSSRAWAGIQRYWPAALAYDSAVRLAGDKIHVAISAERSAPVTEPKVVVHRLEDFAARVHLDRSPPSQRYEDAVIAACSGLSRRAALELISEACRSRRTTPQRLRDELVRRPNVTHRAWIKGVLDDAADGVQSVLESVYLRRVERPHGLPRGERQVRESTEPGIVYRDVLYRAFDVQVELDGRLGHEGFEDKGADLARDLLAVAHRGRLTLRVGWHQSDVEPCTTAAAIGVVLRQRGWGSSPRACGEGCAAGLTDLGQAGTG
jgi:hypothetical protein